MERIWLSHYPEGVPTDIDLKAFASLRNMFQTSCARFGEKPAYSNMGATLSFARLDALSRDFAAYLQGLGLKKGDRVALMMPNLLQYPVALWGVLRAGLVVVNVNPQYTANELAFQLKDSGAAAILVLENFAHTLEEVLARGEHNKLHVIATEVGDLFPLVQEMVTNITVKYIKHLVPAWHIPAAVQFNVALRKGQVLPLAEVALTGADAAFLQYTGGTTGVAKGAILSHSNMVANVLQLSAWVALGLEDGKEVFVCPLPLYHIYALSSALVFLKIGAHTLLITNPRDLPGVVKDLQKYRVTAIIGVNTFYRALMDAPGFATIDFSGLKMVNAGGMAVQQSVADNWHDATGVPIIESYGLTEASPGVAANPLNIVAWTGDIGMPLPSTDVIVVDEHDNPVETGQMGEICVRGPQVMMGYWNRPEETHKAFSKGGWLHTGDIGLMHENGSLRMTDRKKDIIIVSGFKVYPTQVEDAVALHPDVAEVAAIGMEDARSGEVVKIIVVRKNGELTEAQLLAHCREHLTGYKMPRAVEFRTEPLPKSNVGKILRRQLREPQVLVMA